MPRLTEAGWRMLKASSHLREAIREAERAARLTEDKEARYQRYEDFCREVKDELYSLAKKIDDLGGQR